MKLARRLAIVVLVSIIVVCVVKLYPDAEKYVKGRIEYIDARAQYATGGDGQYTIDDGSGNRRTVNLDKLIADNPDAIGWLVIPGTPIDYPVVQTSNNSFYLSHGLSRKPLAAGAIFADYRFSGPHYILYGHHMRDGSMFGSLQKYLGSKYQRKHRKLYFISNEGKQVYYFQSCGKIKGTDAIPPTQSAASMTLITCDYTYDNGRFYCIFTQR